MDTGILLFLQLLLAHILVDFVFQPSGWIEHKRRYKGKSYILILHSLLAGITTLLFLQSLEFWHIAIFIAVTHFLIDLWKLHQNKDDLKHFLLDQVLHLLMIIIAWLYIINGFPYVAPFILGIINSPEILIVFMAYIIVIFPAGYVIGKATKRWHLEIEATHKNQSLDAAGRYIGIFERILVLSFIITNNFAAIGFLIAAKSILRFSDKTESGARKQTEYVLIGTLMSFALTILLGLLVNYLVFQ